MIMLINYSDMLINMCYLSISILSIIFILYLYFINKKDNKIKLYQLGIAPIQGIEIPIDSEIISITSEKRNIIVKILFNKRNKLILRNFQMIEPGDKVLSKGLFLKTIILENPYTVLDIYDLGETKIK